MKRYLAFLFSALICLSLYAGKKTQVNFVTAASDGRITYVGRTLVSGNEVSFDWTGTYVRFAFEGEYLALKITDTKKDYFNVWIDRPISGGDADKVVAFEGKDTLIVLYDADPLKGKNKSHTLTIQKRTEGEQGKVTVSEVVTHGALLQAEPMKDRFIEFIGDSYTCGYGSENSIFSDKFSPETENQNKAYDAILGRYFDADIHVIAHSGMGINRNYNDKLRGYTMVERYLNVFDNGFDRVENAPLWTPLVKPDITVIYLGANDFSAGRQPVRSQFVKDYIKLLKEIKDYYGEDHPILCCTSRMEIYDYVSDAVAASGLKKITAVSIVEGISVKEVLGAGSHPGYPAHRKIAMAFAPYIATLTGWPLRDFEM